MKNQKIDRRRFLINSLQGAAGAGILVGCDKRTVIGSDVRSPSTPVGLSQKLSALPNDLYSVDLTWTPHDGTDITGAKTETAITYNVYRKTDQQAAFGLVPLATLLQTSAFSDTSTEVQDAFVRLKTSPDIVFEYKISAIDATKVNESPLSNALAVPIQPFIDIFFVTNPAAAPGTNLMQPNIQPDVVKTMVHAAVMKMTGQATVAAAWESLFPSLSSATLIGIKINTLGMGNVSTKPQVVDAIVGGLTQMLDGAFPAYNIIVFDDRGINDHMKPAGFIVRNTPGMYRIASTHVNTTLDPATPVTVQQQDADLWGTPFSVANVNERLSALVESLDYIINVPVMKDHIQSGITFSMKNLYGLIDSPSTLHDNMCNPFIPALYSAETNGVKLRDKIRLIVGDALVGCSTGGPAGGPNIKPCTIVVGTDPVAMDKWALDKINTYRNAKAQIPLTYVQNASQDARHIFYASQPPYSLGSTNYAAREVTA
jgi:uncharacterized protein (DUF362 family)